MATTTTTATIMIRVADVTSVARRRNEGSVMIGWLDIMSHLCESLRRRGGGAVTSLVCSLWLEIVGNFLIGELID